MAYIVKSNFKSGTRFQPIAKNAGEILTLGDIEAIGQNVVHSLVSSGVLEKTPEPKIEVPKEEPAPEVKAEVKPEKKKKGKN